MSLQIKRSVGKVTCAVVGHEISEEEEDKLFRKPPNPKGIREIESQCKRCGAKLLLRVDPTDEDSYFEIEI
jgi:hypothetical protein